MQVLARRYTTGMVFGLFIAAITWWAIIFQCILRTGSFTNFLSYFTVQTNLLIALCLSFSLLLPNSVLGRFFSGAPVQTAIALYILVVALVYNTVLRGLVTLTGWNIVLDNVLHVLVPILYLFYWLFFSPGTLLKWRDGLYWLAFPAAYLFYSLLRGSIVGWYPYPFLNAVELGYGKVMQNIGLMILVFLVSGLLFIWGNNKLKK